MYTWSPRATLYKIPGLNLAKNKLSLTTELQNVRSSSNVFYHLFIKGDKFIEITVNPNFSSSLQWC